MKDLEQILVKISDYLPCDKVIRIGGRILEQINSKVFEHTLRTTYIAYRLSKANKLIDNELLSKIVLLSYFHTIGFYREDVFFEYNPQTSVKDYFSDSDSTNAKYVFARCFLEYKTPVKEIACSIENFNTPNFLDTNKTDVQLLIKKIINFSSHMSDLLSKGFTNLQLGASLELLLLNNIFDKELTKSFFELNSNQEIAKKIKTGDYKAELDDFIDTIDFSNHEATGLRRFVLFFMDFKSTVTMRHLVNTSCYALSLADRLGLNNEDITKLLISSLLHDIGKISIPQKILECQRALNSEEMDIMRLHVDYAEPICKGLISDEILENILSHHEKLNGNGYPKKKSEKELSLVQRILTVSDITSALNDSRPYKSKFMREETISILNQMAMQGELDKEIVKITEQNFDSIFTEQVPYRKQLSLDVSHVFDKYNDFLLTIIQNQSQEEIPELEGI